MSQQELAQNYGVVIPAASNTTGNFDTTTDGINLKNYRRCTAILMITSSSTCVSGTITLKQGTTADADTALTFDHYYRNLDTIANEQDWTRVAAATATSAGASTASFAYMFEIKADSLGTDTMKSENTYVRLDSEGMTNVTAASLVYILHGPRVARGGDNMPSVA